MTRIDQFYNACKIVEIFFGWDAQLRGITIRGVTFGEFVQPAKSFLGIYVFAFGIPTNAFVMRRTISILPLSEESQRGMKSRFSNVDSVIKMRIMRQRS